MKTFSVKPISPFVGENVPSKFKAFFLETPEEFQAAQEIAGLSNSELECTETDIPCWVVWDADSLTVWECFGKNTGIPFEQRYMIQSA